VDAYLDREDAGRRLGAELARRDLGDVVVLGLPRGGVPVAAPVAVALGAPLDVIVVRKLGVPSRPELAMGAIAEGGVRVLDERVVRRAGVAPWQLEEVEAREREALAERVARLRHGRPRPELAGRTALVVDDGVATGATASAAARAARRLGAARVVVAAPVGATDAIQGLRDADEVVCPRTPEPFGAVAAHYVRFEQTSDAEVERLLAVSPDRPGPRRRLG